MAENTNTNQEKGFWDYATPILTGMGAAAVTGAYNNYAVNKQNEFNAKEAERNREFEERMSNTAYTRAYADMAAAGLNPHLAGGQGGASSPAGTAATGAQAMPLDINGAINAAANAALTKSQIQNMKADTTLKDAQAGKTEADTKMTEVMTDIEAAKAPLERALMAAQTDKEKNEAQKIMAEYNAKVKELQVMDAEIISLKADGKLKEAQAKQIKRLTKGIQTREWINTISNSIGQIVGAGAKAAMVGQSAVAGFAM